MCVVRLEFVVNIFVTENYWISMIVSMYLDEGGAKYFNGKATQFKEAWEVFPQSFVESPGILIRYIRA